MSRNPHLTAILHQMMSGPLTDPDGAVSAPHAPRHPYALGEKPMPYDVYYNPEAPSNPTGKFKLDSFDDRSEAVVAAEEYGKTYYGENSPVWVLEGRKKIHNVPAGRG